MRILIMGLPDSGKTTFAQELRKHLQDKKKIVVWYNADIVREMNNDWDFSKEGRIRQAKRMREYSDSHVCVDYVICDFVAPLKEMRDIFGADYTVWMDTEESGRFENTNKVFEKPDLNEKIDYVVKAKDVLNTVPPFIKLLGV